MDFSDDFERPDGAPGAPWTFAGSGTWAIVSGKLVHTAGAGIDAAVVDVGEADVNVITPLFGAQTGQFVRYIDLNNTLMVVAGTGPVFDGLWKIVAGVASRIMATAAILGNALLEVLCVGDTVRIASNDVVFGTHTMTGPEAAQFTTPTKFGLRAFSNLQQAHESIDILRYIGNVETYPADVDIDTAVSGFGLNVGSAAFSRWAYDLAKRQGATEIRFPFGWEFAEDVDNPGTYPGTQLPIVAEALGWCAELGLKPLLIAQYGPPRSVVMTVHVDGDHPIGSTSLTVLEDVSGIDFQFGRDFIGGIGVGIGKPAYYGGVIAAIPSAHVIELGAATVDIPGPGGPILDGTAFTINRLLYSAIATDSGLDPSAVAFANYAHALAVAIATHCPEGGAVELWNEPPWANDGWDMLAQFFDTPSDYGVAEWDQLLSPILQAVAGMEWPENIEVYNSATNKSGQATSALNVLPKADLVPIVADTYHPYDVEPEVYWWGRGPTCVGTNWGPGYRNLLGTASFAAGAKQEDEAGFRRRVTECGYGGIHPDPDWELGMISYSIRKIVGAWSMGYEMVNFFSMVDAPYPMVDADTQLPYPSLVRLGQFMRFLRTVAADVGDYTLPTIRFYEGTLPLFRVNVGPVLVCWQRSPAGAAPTYKPQWPAVEKVTITDVPGSELRVLNTTRRVHESVNVGPDDEHTLYFGAEPLVVTWRTVG